MISPNGYSNSSSSSSIEVIDTSSLSAIIFIFFWRGKFVKGIDRYKTKELDDLSNKLGDGGVEGTMPVLVDTTFTGIENPEDEEERETEEKEIEIDKEILDRTSNGSYKQLKETH
ncbi:hypothetical protein M0804_010157 [Polistes exclamans]|nr:hypothetical protein M0804_010157 [Polistes exclamans]